MLLTACGRTVVSLSSETYRGRTIPIGTKAFFHSYYIGMGQAVLERGLGSLKGSVPFLRAVVKGVIPPGDVEQFQTEYDEATSEREDYRLAQVEVLTKWLSEHGFLVEEGTPFEEIGKEVGQWVGGSL